MRKAIRSTTACFSHAPNENKRRPGGRLLPLAVVFVLLFSCVFFTGCGSEKAQDDSGVRTEQSVSSVNDSKNKDSKEESKEKENKAKEKTEKESNKEDSGKAGKAADTAKAKDSNSGKTSSDKSSGKTKQEKQKTGKSTDKDKTSGDSDKTKPKKKKAKYCYFSVTCHRLTEIKDELPESLQKLVPDSGVIVSRTKVKFKGGESAFDITKKVLREKNIHISYQGTTQYGTAYIEAINNIYEKDVNSRSGWIYKVNGKMPGVGCSAYSIGNNDVIEWAYTCDLGEDL